MECLAGEAPRIVGYERIAMMAGADQQIVEDFGVIGLFRSAAIGDMHRPASVGAALDLCDARAQTDVRMKIEGGGIAFEIGEDLPMRRKIRVVARHRMVVEARQVLRRNDVGAFVDADPIDSFAEDPVAADRVAVVVADDVAQTDGAEIFDGGEPARAGADHADARIAGDAAPGRLCQ